MNAPRACTPPRERERLNFTRRAPRLAWAALAALTSASATAQDYLPPEAQIHAALRAQPTVRAAAARNDAATATADALAVGSHEFQASLGAQSRRVTGEGLSYDGADGNQRRYNEWELQVSRAIRLPGKADLDRQIGDSTRHVAGLRLADAEHQAARRLLETWMDYLRNEAAVTAIAAQETLLDREKDALARRIALGDAARRDMDVLLAERAQLAAQAIAAREAATLARQTLGVEFPEILIPAQAPALPDPQPLPDGAQAWHERIVRESAEIGIADGESARLSLVAARARAERAPDPSIGLRLMSERGGAERVVGVVLSVPFGTGYRSALAASESANAAAADADALGVRRQTEQGAQMAVQAAESKRLQWQSRRQALAAQDTASERTRRAWQLGEAALAEYLLAQRDLRQAQLAETLARADALQAALLVRIDAHELWHSHRESAAEE